MAVRSREALPAIVVEGTTGAALGSSTLVDVRPPGSALAQRLAGAAKRARDAYDIRIGTHRGCDPRVHSLVEHRLPAGAGAVLDALAASAPVAVTAGAAVLTGDPSRLTFDPVEHEHRFPAGLHLRWSWPALPMWLAVGELTPGRCALRLSLRSRHRVRYPARYFDAAHRALAALEGEVCALRRPAAGEAHKPWLGGAVR